MRDVERRYARTSHPPLSRTADGHLQPVAGPGDRDIADIWADQRRIRLADAIAADKTRAAKKQRLRALLRGGGQPASAASREIEIRIGLPKLHIKRRLARLGRVFRKLSRKQQYLLAAGLFLVILVAVAPTVHKQAAKPGAKTAAVRTQIGGSQPAFDTILPAGKTIQQLGGWGRVSPPDKAPVFGYSDMLAGQHIVVSEQPLPDNFKKDPDSALANLGKQINANEKLSAVDGSTLYIATSTSGAQSAVFTESGLLLFIRSAGKISDDSWLSYIVSLG